MPKKTKPRANENRPTRSRKQKAITIGGATVNPTTLYNVVLHVVLNELADENVGPGINVTTVPSAIPWDSLAMRRFVQIVVSNLLHILGPFDPSPFGPQFADVHRTLSFSQLIADLAQNIHM
ncbi:MAG TPA: hypothetical protein VMN79_17365 [Casimicrobiaceae bacterium]|nr:hypothetical protein [Casimicrobiaceae bacterium]